MIEDLAHEVAAQRTGFGALFGSAEGFEQPFHRVEGPQRVVGRKRFLVRPLVAGIGHFKDQRSGVVAERVAEKLLPGCLHALQNERNIIERWLSIRRAQARVDRFKPDRTIEALPRRSAFGA